MKIYPPIKMTKEEEEEMDARLEGERIYWRARVTAYERAILRGIVDAPEDLRVLVCGGRDYNDYKSVKAMLDPLVHDISLIIQGGAKGADSLASRWACENGIPEEEYEANWKDYGKGAGPRRNTEMIEEGKPDLVIAFKGGKGTQNMMKQAIANKIPVMREYIGNN
jgi:ABC-type Fe3+-hydroxamate transport system substrate-binding protein